MKIKIKRWFILILFTITIISLDACKKKEEIEEEPIYLQTLSTNISFIEDSYSAKDPFGYEIIVEESVLEKQKTVISDEVHSKKGYWWIASVYEQGTPKKEEVYYKYTYDIYGDLLSKVEVPNTTTIIAAKDKVYEYYGEIEIGSIFYPRFTKFGYNCGACYVNASGYTQLASGIQATGHSVRQYDGTWEEGITYEGYYMIAMTTDMPICTIVEISNHSYSGMGIEPGKSFKAIVADRGVGANRIDLFVGDEDKLNLVSQTKKNSQPKVTIVAFGYRKKVNGYRTCSV